MLQATENIFIKTAEPTQSCLFALHTIVLKYDAQMGEDFKYGIPLQFCYIWVDKKTQYPYLLMVKGNKIEHPDLEKGDRKQMKILTINPNKDIPMKKIDAIFKMAMTLY